MRIQINDKNEIIGYVTEGDLEGGIEVEIPNYLLEDFQPRKLIYVNGKIEINTNYSEDVNKSTQTAVTNTLGNDGELRKMFANMQIQLVQANMIVMQLSKQNARLSQEMVVLNQKIDGGSEYENVIPKVRRY
ncbi:hypothetical protein CTJ08_12850 [Staphylococcus epidermidis]|uniref:DUF2977 domain-containing protein n=2 Tax=Staphylococcus epidermidis TaxID=1282 RepID=A0AAE5QVL6_STAEP|nr:DUF2977 domain-containing protein [Staphylococcus epidermidis]PIH09098.1 hypothetical protein CTJ08_12850 [Staphylococcus epidermidis]